MFYGEIEGGGFEVIEPEFAGFGKNTREFFGWMPHFAGIQTHGDDFVEVLPTLQGFEG